MDKQYLIKRLAASNPQLKPKETELAVKVVLDALCSSLAVGGRVEIRGFGSFSLSPCKPRQKRDQNISVYMNVPVKYVPMFKPAKELRARVGKCAEANTANRIHLPIPMTPSPLNPVVMRNMANTENHV